MPGPDTLVEEAPVFTYLLIGLGFCLSWLEYRALRYVWGHTIGWVFGKIAGVGIPTGFFGKIHPLRFLEDVNTTVMNYLAEQALEAEQAMGRAFHQAAYVQEWVVRELYDGLRDLYSWADGLQNRYLRKLFKALFLGLFPWVAIGRLVKAAVHAALAPVRAEIRAVDRSIPKRLHRLLRAAVIAAFPLITTLPWLHSEVRTFNRRWEQIKARLRRLEGLLTTVGFAAAMAAVLGVTARCLSPGGPVGKTARKLCGLGPQALEDLLGLIVDVVLIADVCEVTVLLNDALSLIEPEITGFVSTFEGALCHGDYSAPPALTVAPLSLPPVTGLTLSLA